VKELKTDSLVSVNQDITDVNFGNSPSRRSVAQLLEYGIIPLDKPAGPTSHEVVAWVRRLLDVKKAGHSGTLDPQVTGLLPLGLGEGTKVLSTLLLGPKEYHAVARLHDSINDMKLSKILDEFTGEIYQKPPQRSSVKRVTRSRTIYELELLEKQDNLLLLRILCQAGTYVRKLIYDIGEVLGPGATMIELRRSRVCHINEVDGLVRLHDLAYAINKLREEGTEDHLRRLVRPVEFATSWMKTVVMRDGAVDAICHGAQLAIPGICKLSHDIVQGDSVAMYTLKGELVAIGEALMSTNEILAAQHGLAFTTKRVILKVGTYPRLWKVKQKNTEDIG
jgi:H/ACA ribonucleoprotein complex subunit 4